MANLNPPPGTGTSTALGDALAEALNVGYCLVTDEQSKAFDSAGQSPKLRKRTRAHLPPAPSSPRPYGTSLHAASARASRLARSSSQHRQPRRRQRLRIIDEPAPGRHTTTYTFGIDGYRKAVAP